MTHVTLDIMVHNVIQNAPLTVVTRAVITTDNVIHVVLDIMVLGVM